jgi:chemotaxis regulatin CheY-phosphate phosphatase CheZ
MTNVRRLSRKEYLAFEELIASTAEGRAFLRQRDSLSRVVAAERVRRMMKQLMISPRASADANPPASEHVRILRKELLEISAHIQQTRNEIAALHPDDTGASRIVHATSELDAIVSATERATYDILNGAERIQAAAAKLPAAPEVSALAAEIGKQATEIMTACSFQDLTGQRISKVVNALRYIETRINAMIEIWGIDEAARAAATAPAPADNRPDAHLLNGPQLEGAADQNEIDSLFEAAPAPPSDEGAVDAAAQ